MQIIARTLSAAREVIFDDDDDSRLVYLRTSHGVEYTIREDGDGDLTLSLVAGRGLRFAPTASNMVTIEATP